MDATRKKWSRLASDGANTEVGFSSLSRENVYCEDRYPRFNLAWGWKRNESQRHAAEERLKMFACRLAFLERAARRFCMLAFGWAAVVVLGGYGTFLTFEGFWVVLLILSAEAFRIFNRCPEIWWELRFNGTKTARGSDGVQSCESDGRRISHFGDIVQSSSPVDVSSCSSRPIRVMKRTSISLSTPQPAKGAILSRSSWRNITFLSVHLLSDFLWPCMLCCSLYCLQLLSAVLCVGLSVWGLSRQTYCFRDEDQDGDRCPGYHKNVIVAVNLSYSLAFIEAALFLFKEYCECRICCGCLIDEAKEDIAPELDSFIFIKFCYSIYTTSLKGSVLNGQDMNLVAFGIQSIGSDDVNEQLHGARLIRRFLSSKGKKNAYRWDTLRGLSTTPGTMERLAEVLSWGSKGEAELVGEFAGIVKILVKHDQNWSRFAAVPGALDAVVSLLVSYTNISDKDKTDGSASKLEENCVIGLKILKSLCNAYANSLEIGETRGLLSILVLFIQLQNGSWPWDVARWKVYENSLEVLYRLSASKSTSGRAVRQQIADMPSVLKNLRDGIERCNRKTTHLQLLSMEVLHNLALEWNIRCSIGETGGIVRSLFRIFQESCTTSSVCSESVKTQASTGAAASEDLAEKIEREEFIDCQNRMKVSSRVLSRLMLHNMDNCLALLSCKDEFQQGPRLVVDVLIGALRHGEDAVKVSVAEILRTVMVYGDETTRTWIAERSAEEVLAIVSNPLGVDIASLTYEARLGLASRALEVLPPAQYGEVLLKYILISNRDTFLLKLVKDLRHTPTTSELSNVRRYTVEMIIALVERDDGFLDAVARYRVRNVLDDLLDSISATENFVLFSGLIGYEQHADPMKCLVRRCIGVIDRRLSS